MFNVGAQIEFSIRISNYYFWIFFASDINVYFLQKLWPKDWWKGNFFKESEVNMSFDGDFIMASPMHVNFLTIEEIIVCNIVNFFYHRGIYEYIIFYFIGPKKNMRCYQ